MTVVALPRMSLERGVRLHSVLMEVLWVYPWLIWVGQWDLLSWERLPLTLISAVSLCGIAAAVTRWALNREWSLALARLATLSLLLLALAVVIRLDQNAGLAPWDPGWWRYVTGHMSLVAAAAAFGAYLLWRGIAVGRDVLVFDDLYHKFLLGLGALAALLVVWGTSARIGPANGVTTAFGLYVVAYFAVGLLALALANLDAIRAELSERGEPIGRFNRRWLTVLAGVVLGIVVVSVGVAAIFSFNVLALLLRPLGVVATWLLQGAVYGIGYPLGFLAAGLIHGLRWLVSLLGGPRKAPPFQPPDLSELQKTAEGQQAHGFPVWAVLALKWGLLALVVLVVLVILARALFRSRQGKEEEVEEVSESLWSWAAFRADLASIVAWLFQWWRRRGLRPGPAPVPPLAVAQADEDVQDLDIREIYRGVLWEGSHAGCVRGESDTPYEYAARLGLKEGMPNSAIQAITEAYVEVRYGGAAIVGERLTLLNRLWRKLRLGLRAG